MQNRRFNDWGRPRHWVAALLPAIAFVLIAAILFVVNAFPALYGDEYSSLFESHHLLLNLHAIGYLSQLYFWSSISNSDAFLRILSLLWFGAGLHWLNAWLKDEQISSRVRIFTVWLALLNSFLWVYGFQIRFYAMFFAASILFIWRFRIWQKSPSSRSALLLALSGLLLITSHLFGALVLATVCLHFLWTRFTGRRWVVLSIIAVGSLLILLPPVRGGIIWVVYRASNPYAAIPAPSARGISLAMLVKIPFTFYFFTLGERVYPLWGWVSVPAMIIMGTAFVLGLRQLRRLPGLGSLIVFMLLNIPLLFLVLDPLAPPALQGAAPRYVIFVIPYLLLLLALGAEAWRPLMSALVFICLTGLFFLAFPAWSYGGDDFMNWPTYLKAAVPQPRQTCIITDGRAQAAVTRYAPFGTKLALMGKVSDCLGFSRIVFVSDDFRLSQVRYMDTMEAGINNDYSLISNVTLFPAQITVYDKEPAQSIPSQFVPSRLDLPEQDLRLPVYIPAHGWQINGFARLDDATPIVTVPLNTENAESLWLLTDFRSENASPSGTPVFSLRFNGTSGHDVMDLVLHAGQETADWAGTCDSCAPIYEWTKSLQLLGSYAYPGAHSQYQAHIWGRQLTNLDGQKFDSVTVKYLLPDGTGYFWGIYPDGGRTEWEQWHVANGPIEPV